MTLKETRERFAAFISAFGYPPGVSDLAREYGGCTNDYRKNLTLLCNMGFLTHTGKTCRPYRPTSGRYAKDAPL